MKELKHYTTEELKKPVYELISLTSIELGLRTDAKTMVALSKIFTNDLIVENRFNRLTFNQIKDAFRQGVRFGNFEPFLNIRTFYRWIRSHKKVIDNATYMTENLKQKNVPFYQPKLNLLK